MDNKVFDIADAWCNHEVCVTLDTEVYSSTSFLINYIFTEIFFLKIKYAIAEKFNNQLSYNPKRNINNFW